MSNHRQSVVTESPGIGRAHFGRLASEYRRDWPVRMCVVDARGARRFASGWWTGRDRPEHRELLAFNVQEGLRWGEPTVSYCPDQRLYWTVPLMLNATLLGGLVAGLNEDDLFPRGIDRSPLDLQQACRRLRELAERENLTNAALLALHRAESRREHQRAEALHTLKLDGITSVRQLYLREEPQLLAAVRRGDRGEARLILNRILTTILHHAGDRFDLVKSFFMELVATVCRTAVEAGADPEAMLGNNYQSMASLGAIRSMEQLSPWLQELLERTMDALAARGEMSSSVAIVNAVAYMQQHLQEPIGRDDVAAAAALSPSHFSRLFKRHVGRSFSQTLARMRVDHAAELLTRTDLPVGEVARAAGFADPAYFTRTFCRLTRKTPREYRRSLESRTA